MTTNKRRQQLIERAANLGLEVQIQSTKTKHANYAFKVPETNVGRVAVGLADAESMLCGYEMGLTVVAGRMNGSNPRDIGRAEEIVTVTNNMTKFIGHAVTVPTVKGRMTCNLLGIFRRGNGVPYATVAKALDQSIWEVPLSGIEPVE